MCVEKLGWVEGWFPGGGDEVGVSAERVGSSQRSFTSAVSRAPATSSQIVSSKLSWTRSVSTALHAAG
jgi:hypothetical protein